jgi:hypothetical protein
MSGPSKEDPSSDKCSRPVDESIAEKARREGGKLGLDCCSGEASELSTGYADCGEGCWSTDEKTRRRARFFALGGAPRPWSAGFAKLGKTEPLDMRSSLCCEGDEGAGEDERSCSTRGTASGDKERRFFGWGPPGVSKEVGVIGPSSRWLNLVIVGAAEKGGEGNRSGVEATGGSTSIASSDAKETDNSGGCPCRHVSNAY